MTISTCEARRRDGSRCPHAWKHALHTGVSRYWPDHLPHPKLRTVYLCGQHKNALGKGVMVVRLEAEPGREAWIYAGREGDVYYQEREADDE